MATVRRLTVPLAAGAFLLVVALAVSQLPVIGAGGLLHPARRAVVVAPPSGCRSVTFAGDSVSLAGWECAAAAEPRGTVVYLHGIADNRTSVAGAIDRFTSRGFAVVAYDSRAHGESEGEACTYGFFETRDLQRVLDAVSAGPVVLVGTSLGAAVALQYAPRDPRIGAVIAAETFADLRSIATERAPFFFIGPIIRRAFHIAEQRGRFQVDAVSPLAAAPRITAPVLLVHGALDVDTSPEHSRRVFSALGGPRRLILVDRAGHNESLNGEAWNEIERWLDGVTASWE